MNGGGSAERRHVPLWTCDYYVKMLGYKMDIDPSIIDVNAVYFLSLRRASMFSIDIR